jgi:hypothetical protein
MDQPQHVERHEYGGNKKRLSIQFGCILESFIIQIPLSFPVIVVYRV